MNMSDETKRDLRRLQGMFHARHLAKCGHRLDNPFTPGTPEHDGFETIADLHCTSPVHLHGVTIARSA